MNRNICKYLSSLTVQEDLMCSQEGDVHCHFQRQSPTRERSSEILVRETDAFHQGIIVDASESQMVFTISNVSDEESARDAKEIAM